MKIAESIHAYAETPRVFCARPPANSGEADGEGASAELVK
jgi:hypothetical protein